MHLCVYMENGTDVRFHDQRDQILMIMQRKKTKRELRVMFWGAIAFGFKGPS